MEDFYQILQYSVGVEREILVIGSVCRIASIQLLVLEGLELGVWRIIFTDLA